MKLMFRFLPLAAIAVLLIAFSSCAGVRIEKRHYRGGFYVSRAGDRAHAESMESPHDAFAHTFTVPEPGKAEPVETVRHEQAETVDTITAEAVKQATAAVPAENILEEKESEPIRPVPATPVVDPVAEGEIQAARSLKYGIAALVCLGCCVLVFPAAPVLLLVALACAILALINGNRAKEKLCGTDKTDSYAKARKGATMGIIAICLAGVVLAFIAGLFAFYFLLLAAW